MIPPPKVCPPPYCEGADICPPPVSCFKSCSTICEEFQISLPAEVLAFCWLTMFALFCELPATSPKMPERREPINPPAMIQCPSRTAPGNLSEHLEICPLGSTSNTLPYP